MELRGRLESASARKWRNTIAASWVDGAARTFGVCENTPTTIAQYESSIVDGAARTFGVCECFAARMLRFSSTL